MNKKIIIQIPFNIQGLNIKNEMNEEWIRYRLKIFNNYTLKSLIAQTNQHFTLLFRCREETIPFIKKEIGESLPENILIIGKEHEQKIKDLIKDYKYLYLVRLDSDDMYINIFMDMLHNYTPKLETEALMNGNGYVYNHNTKELAIWEYLSPPFFSLIYEVTDYLKGKRYHLKDGHSGVKFLKYEILSGRNYMVVVHEKNNVTTFEYKARKELIFDGKSEILKSFGLFEKENI